MNAQVIVSDLNGRKAKVFPVREYEAGTHQLTWSSESGMIARGMYLVQLMTDNAILTQKLIKN